MASSPTLLLLLLIFLAAVSAHNITDILSRYPDYSQFNSYLTQTRLADDINARNTITVLALSNSAMSSLVAQHHPLSVIKNLLSLHILLDYYDPQKLHTISDGTTLTTTLYQTTGNAPGTLGFVNITDLKGGQVGFGSAAPGSKLDSTYTKSVKQIPYTISVLQISAPITAPAILAAPAPAASDLNVTALLVKAGCKTFAALLAQTGVVNLLKSRIQKGDPLTVFAPKDMAFTAQGVPDLSKLSQAELVELLQYHALDDYAPKGTLKARKHPISTIASSSAGKFDLTTSSSGDDVVLHTGVDSSRIASTVLDSTPVVIFTVDSVLIPQGLFPESPSRAPAPAPASAPAVNAPVKPPTHAAEAPTPVASPPAPPTETPGGAPADVPSGDQSENSESESAAGEVRGPGMVLQGLLLFVSVVVGLVVVS